MLGPPIDNNPPLDGHRLVSGWWSGDVSGAGVVVPDGAIDVMWAPGEVPWLAGPDTSPRPVDRAAGTWVVGVRLRPGVGQPVLGDRMDLATDQAVQLDAVWEQAKVSELIETLHSCERRAHAAHALAAAIERRVSSAWQPDATVLREVSRLRAGTPAVDHALSERQLRRRFTQAMGYGPTFFGRVARLDRFTELVVRQTHRSNAELAATAGFFDEAHLWRDARSLTGSSPGELRRQQLLR